MKKITVLDVTLRDGGCVNNFNFGQVYMEKILNPHCSHPSCNSLISNIQIF